MNNKSIVLIIFNFWILYTNAQVYTTYFTGNSTDLIIQPKGGACLMGGGSENDDAMRWFLHQANGGDIVVLRTSGGDGYNDYMFSELGVNINSVETIVCNNELSGNDEYIISRLEKAEGLWLAGGNQATYLSFWRNSPLLQTIQNRINNGMVIGGISAGMAVLGQHYFSAENGTITSSEALLQPYHPNLTLGSNDFFNVPFLENTITDTHYNNPDRKGRHTVFISRLINQYPLIKGVACDEHVAVCIDSTGIATIYGDYPTYSDYAWFIRPNCSIANNSPEIFNENAPLTWSQNQEALTVYKIPANGINTFNLNNWQNGTGGMWEYWFVDNGELDVADAAPINCFSGLYELPDDFPTLIWEDESTFRFNIAIDHLVIYNSVGQIINFEITQNGTYRLKEKLGVYFLHILKKQKIFVLKVG